MAKSNAKAEKATTKEETKKKRVPKPKNPENYTHLNRTVEGKNEIVTRVLHIRNFGVHIETTAYHDGKIVSVSTNFVPGLKPKSKKEAKFLVVDKGPKPKKEKKDKKSEKK